MQEIKENIKYLKTKNAPGLDNITNEMIKCSDRNMIEHPQTLLITLWNLLTILPLGTRD